MLSVLVNLTLNLSNPDSELTPAGRPTIALEGVLLQQVFGHSGSFFLPSVLHFFSHFFADHTGHLTYCRPLFTLYLQFVSSLESSGGKARSELS